MDRCIVSCIASCLVVYITRLDQMFHCFKLLIECKCEQRHIKVNFQNASIKPVFMVLHTFEKVTFFSFCVCGEYCRSKKKFRDF